MLVVREMLLSGSQLVFLFGCLLSFVAAAAKHNNEKRLLLNDPDVTGRRLAHLESTQQELTRLIHRFNTNISTLQAENKNLQATNAAFEAKHSDLQSKYTALQSRTMQLESHTAKQDKMIANIQGYVARQQYHHPKASSHYGGPATTLCLPSNPELDLSHTVSTDNLLYGTEYKGNEFGTNSNGEDMPCAVCRRNSLSTTVMIPGRKSCYPGWRIEYNGLLAGGYSSESASSYLCLDKILEYIPSGHKNEDGHTVFFISFKCGPLPCPPYKDNTIVNCVVCSK